MGRKLRLAIVALCLLVLLGAGACKPQLRKPDKIPRMNILTTKPDGARVEFVGWIRAVEGDNDVGIELYMSESPNSFPQALVDLKDGQPDPGKGHEGCVSGQITKRDEIGGGTIFWLKDAELINCY